MKDMEMKGFEIRDEELEMVSGGTPGVIGYGEADGAPQIPMAPSASGPDTAPQIPMAPGTPQNR